MDEDYDANEPNKDSMAKKTTKLDGRNKDSINAKDKLAEKNSLFHKFNLAQKLEEIETAET